MVNRIDNNNPYEYPRTQNVDSGNRINTEEKFSLDYGNGTNLPGESSKESNRKDISDREQGDTTLRDGVRLELSGQGRKAYDSVKSPGHTDGQTGVERSSLWDSLRGIVRSVADTVRTFLYRLWYDTPKEEETDVPESSAPVSPEAEQPAATAATAEELAFHMRSEEARIDKEIQPYLKSGDLPRVVSLLTDNGRRTVAHNSTLLTYYDRNGNVIEPDASDRERILHGDRNVKRL